MELQPKQFDLLTYLVRNWWHRLDTRPVPPKVWGYDYVGDTRTVDVHVRSLREKLEEDPANPRLIQTVRGVGYCLGGKSLDQEQTRSPPCAADTMGDLEQGRQFSSMCMSPET